jgi:hypothetical protein
MDHCKLTCLMRWILSVILDCEKFIDQIEGFIAQFRDLSLILRIYRSNRRVYRSNTSHILVNSLKQTGAWFLIIKQLEWKTADKLFTC